MQNQLNLTQAVTIIEDRICHPQQQNAETMQQGLSAFLFLKTHLGVYQNIVQKLFDANEAGDLQKLSQYEAIDAILGFPTVKKPKTTRRGRPAKKTALPNGNAADQQPNAPIQME